MQQATNTPANVKRAVAIYVGWRRVIGVATALLLGAAISLAVAIFFMVVDRYAVMPILLRVSGEWIAAAALLAGAGGAIIALLRRHHPFRITVRLDRAFPQHQDRWSSSLDLAEQMAAGRNVGNRANLDRLFADAEILPARLARSIVSRRAMWMALAGFSAVALLLLFVRISPAFDLPLLWARFLHPHADLPRDSTTRIFITDVNGQTFTGDMPGPMPEGSPLSLRVELRRKPGIFAISQHDVVIADADQLAPRLQQQTPTGIRAVEFARAGSGWIFTQPRLEESLQFRLAVDDAMTQTLVAEVVPRVKLARMETAIRFPRYTRLKDQPIQPMQGNRLSTLAESTIEFRATFDRPLQSVVATFEAIQAQQQEAPPTEEERLHRPKRKTAAEPTRRALRMQMRGETGALFTLRNDSSGIIRLSAVGANGLASEQWVCAVEAVPDAPPRIVVTGLEPDTTIMPGETISFHYRAEDDLAVTDVMIDWSSMGGGHSSTLGGDEYLSSSQFGKKVVEGDHLMQRMDYPIYATEPFQFLLTVLDSKGQESHSETFRIHTVNDDYATRFDRGLELLDECGKYERRCNATLGGLINDLKIITKAAGDATKWDNKLNTQFDNLLHGSLNYEDTWFLMKHLTLRYGGVPYRLNRSLQLLMAIPDALATRGDFITRISTLKTADDLPGAIAQLKQFIEDQRPLLSAWAAAIEAEKSRFFVERLLNQARVPATRLATLAQGPQSPEVVAANVKFYLTQIDAWLTAVAPLAAQEPALAPMIEALKTARTRGNANAIVAALHPIIDALSSRDLPADEALANLATAIGKLSEQGDPEHRLATIVSRLVVTSGQNEMLRPAETIALAKPLLSGQTPATWYPATVEISDVLVMTHQVWETLKIYQADLSARRFELNPQEGMDHEAILRERSLATKEALLELPPEAVDSAKRDRLARALMQLAKPGAAAEPQALADLTAAFHAIGVKPIADLGSAANGTLMPLLAAMRGTADLYNQHADAVLSEAAKPLPDGSKNVPSRMLLLDEAARLQVRTEALESLFRSIKLTFIESHLLTGEAPPWSAMEPLHGVQLGLSLAASQAGEGVSRVHLELSNAPTKAAEMYPIAAKNSRELSGRLRAIAQLLESSMSAQPISFDYAQLTKDARAEGVFAALREEYELVVRHATADSATPADDDKKLNDSALAKIVRGEQSMSTLSIVQQQLKRAATANPPQLIKALTALKNILPTGPDAPTIDALPLALKEAVEAPQDQPIAAQSALARHVQAVTDAVAGLVDHYRDQAHLPAISTTAQQNRRFTTRDLPFVWTIQGVIDGFDRRWLYAIRDLELSLTRSMLEAAGQKKGPAASSSPADATDLKLQYARMVEWRARNFANDRRRNQGISLIAANNGPALRLPEHIAAEFFRARNLATPDDFKPRIETYYEELYRDLSK